MKNILFIMVVTAVVIGWVLPRQSLAIGGNPSITDIGQFEPTGLSAIEVGATAQTQSVLFSSFVGGDNESGTIAMCVEIQPTGTDFANIATACGSAIAYEGEIGFEASVQIDNQVAGSYHWQTYAIDDLEHASDWIPFGFNEEDEVDYVIVAADNPADDPADDPDVTPTGDETSGSISQTSSSSSVSSTTSELPETGADALFMHFAKSVTMV